MRTFYLIFFLFTSNFLNAQTKVGVVNSQKVLDALPYRDSMIRVLEKIEQEGLEELTRIDSLIQIKMSSVPHNVNYDSPALESYSKSFRKLQEDFQIREKELDSTLPAIGNQLNVTCIKMIKAASEIVASSMGIDLIVDESVMLYYEDKIDITQQVINELLKPAK
jgi:Skp family chaperone for outer membrane proteins